VAHPNLTEQLARNRQPGVRLQEFLQAVLRILNIARRDTGLRPGSTAAVPTLQHLPGANQLNQGPGATELGAPFEKY
jgi:hypothetical protein